MSQLRLCRTHRSNAIGIGENPQGWVVRVLDSDPKVMNAFVNGGNYVHVFTGLRDQIKSDNELAIVVGQ